MIDIIQRMHDNVLKETKLKDKYDEWIKLTEAEEEDIPCVFCKDICYIDPAEPCESIKKIVYPQCNFCEEERVRCKCVLGKFQEQLKELK